MLPQLISLTTSTMDKSWTLSHFNVVLSCLSPFLPPHPFHFLLIIMNLSLLYYLLLCALRYKFRSRPLFVASTCRDKKKMESDKMLDKCCRLGSMCGVRNRVNDSGQWTLIKLFWWKVINLKHWHWSVRRSLWFVIFSCCADPRLRQLFWIIFCSLLTGIGKNVLKSAAELWNCTVGLFFFGFRLYHS